MKELVVFYSKTGNTRGISMQIKEILGCELGEIKAVSDDPNQTYVELTNRPDVDSYQNIIIGTPVHGFNLPKITRAYLEELPDLDTKEFDLFVTHFFPFAWMGGNQVLKQMKKIIEQKHGKVNKMTSINWKSKKRQSVIDQMMESYKK